MATALDVLAQNNFGDTRTGGLAGPLGLLIVLLMGVATVLLIRNMNARLRRLPDRFPDPDDTRSGSGAGEAGAGTASGTGASADRSGPGSAARTTRAEPPGPADNTP